MPTTPGGAPTSSGSGQTVRENVQTAGIYRYRAGGGMAQGPPGAATSPVPLTPAWRRSRSRATPSARNRAPTSPTRGSRPTAT